MILSFRRYEARNRKGILFFHQRTPTASGPAVAANVFSVFVSHLLDTLQDQDPTRIRSEDDLGDSEIQMLESLKVKTLRSLPQSPLYWGSDLFYAHVTPDNLYLKVPKWFKVFRMQNNELHSLELESAWTKLDTALEPSLFITLQNNDERPHRIISLASGSLRIAPLLCQPITEYLPLFCLGAV